MDLLEKLAFSCARRPPHKRRTLQIYTSRLYPLAYELNPRLRAEAASTIDTRHSLVFGGRARLGNRPLRSTSA